MIITCDVSLPPGPVALCSGFPVQGLPRLALVPVTVLSSAAAVLSGRNCCRSGLCLAHQVMASPWPMMCRLLSSPSNITAANIIHRIVHNRAAYEARNAKKSKSEAAYYKDKKHVSEV